ncbi:tripartite tricarboxylate transporter substrate binding protein [Lampropedia puyangensis]|uniref:Tripartite tricarboxylate transporter substrate binding protein n=1 Tax=Lampropedia puyangensis TaxID=1330072 RepID=A0A4S8EN52_9BURK|nr:tripartite tricarboxylate transporter substrate binding protein [Lampropedia puyangensis]
MATSGLVLLSCCALFSPAGNAAYAEQTTAEPSAVEQQLGQARFTIVSPFPAGGPVDILARLLAEGLGERYAQAAVVENLAGAAGNLGMEKIKRAKADGHTLLVVPAGNVTINPTLMPNFPFDMAKDFTPITMLAKAPNVLVANADAGISSVAELVEKAKNAPDTLSYASPGVGSGLHLAGELFKAQTQTDILHVAYKGSGPAMNDVLGGILPLMFTNLPTALPHIKTGKLKVLATTSAQRSEAAPDIPTLDEQGVPGIDVTSWYGLFAPADLAPEVAAQLARDAQTILHEEKNLRALSAQGMSEAAQTPAEFTAHIANETAVWRDVIQQRGIRID